MAKSPRKTAAKRTANKKPTKKSPGRSAKKSTTKQASARSTVQVDRRRKDRRGDDRRQQETAVATERRQIERRAKVPRRRQIDPTTCERDYTVEEIEFMNALDDYKRRSGRMFPTCSEILEVIRDLGYRRVSGEEVADSDVEHATVSAAPMTISDPEPLSSPQPARPFDD